MERTALLSITRQFLLLTLLFICTTGIASATGVEPAIHGLTSKPTLPKDVMAALEKDFPDYRIPNQADIVGLWAYERKKHPSQFPYMCEGDFDGDGRKDIAITVVNKRGWKTLVYHHESSGYVLRYEGGNIFGSNTSVYGPQQLVLNTVKKGKVIGGKQLRNDAVVASIYEQSEMVLYWVNGKYTDFTTGD